MVPMMDFDPLETEPDGFEVLTPGHRDLVQVAAFNQSGNRYATCSVDGKIKVFNQHTNGSWNICDTWGAHTAEILQIQWLPPSIHPNLIASIGTDGRFKLWVEDPTIAPGKGRRFNSHSNKPLWEMRSQSRSPYMSFAITHNPETRHTYLALINRSALLTVYENEEPENVESWTELDRVTVWDKPTRGEESSFKVAFDPNMEPCFNSIRQGVPRDSLGIVVASMARASVWRTREITHGVSLGSSSSKELYMAVELKGHRGLVRDVAWAPGNIRGYDIIATACKDGFTRVFHVMAPSKPAKEQRSREFRTPDKADPQRSPENGMRNPPSGIGAGLAGVRSARQPDGRGREGEIIHTAKEVSKLDANRVPVWRVEFDADGRLLGSTGDDGQLTMWKREPSDIWSRSTTLGPARS